MVFCALASISAAGPGAVVGYVPPPPQFRAMGSTIAGQVVSVAHYNNVLYMVGTFTTTYQTNTRGYVATYDITTGAWGILGNGYFTKGLLNFYELRSVFVDTNGVVYVCGHFNSVEVSGGSTVATSGLIKFNGTTWSGFGAGLTGKSQYGYGVVVDDAAYYLYVTGSFATVYGEPIDFLARIDLQTSAVTAMNNGYIGLSNGLRFVGTTLYQLSGGNGLLRWRIGSDTKWALFNNSPIVPCNSIDVDSSGNILMGSNDSMYYYNGTTATWSTLGTLTNTGSYYACGIGPDAKLYAAPLTADSPIRFWTGSTWAQLGTVAGGVGTMHFYNGRIYFGGKFTAVGSVSANNMIAYY